ncbi:MAG: hypothetical protein ISP90_09040 [Nevskia sp.]|nr:hypothetical protein [Nevskia sp.]
MFTQALSITFRILGFRAGPEDFPYDASARLTYACVALGVLASAALAALELTVPGALLLGVATVGALGLYTRVVLRARKLENRIQQTFNALLATSSMLSLALIFPLQQMLPALNVFAERLKTHPELLQDPNSAPLLPMHLVLLAMVLLVWQFAVTAHILRRAANLRMAGGIFLALLCVLTVLCFKVFFSALVQ